MRIYRIAWKEILRTDYLRIYRIAWPRNKLDILTNEITNRIFYYIKDNYRNIKNQTSTMRKFPTGIEVEVEDKIGERVVGVRKKISAVFLYTIITDEEERWSLHVNGIFDPEIADVSIYVRLNRNYFSEKYFDVLSREIDRTLRHEIEHIGQFKNKKFPKERGYSFKELKNPTSPISGFRNRVKYLYADQEVNAFIRSLKRDAIRNEISLKSSIKEFVHNQLFTDDRAIEMEIRNNVGSEADIIENNIVDFYINRVSGIYPILDMSFKPRR